MSSLEIQNVSRLLYLIRTEQIRPPPNPIPLPSQTETNDRLAVPPIGESHKHHHRSSSATMSTALPPNPLDRRKGSSTISIISSSEVSPRDLRQGKAFDTGCICQTSSRKPCLPSRLCVGGGGGGGGGAVSRFSVRFFGFCRPQDLLHRMLLSTASERCPNDCYDTLPET